MQPQRRVGRQDDAVGLLRGGRAGQEVERQGGGVESDAGCLDLLLGGGLLVGFGARWAGGCTSGHAISGLANLQLPSLVAVIGFFAGGLVATHLLFPLLF